jgi:hypothetical protein
MKVISLSRGMVTVVDDEDYDYLMQWSWHAMKSGTRFYASGSQSYPDRTVEHFLMHRVIMKAAIGEFIDHVNRDSLDNRKENLRSCTQGQNLMNSSIRSDNTSGFKGVSKTRQGDKWRATIQVNGASRQVGVFQTSKEAAEAYDRSATEHFGPFALTNSALGLISLCQKEQ